MFVWRANLLVEPNRAVENAQKRMAVFALVISAVLGMHSNFVRFLYEVHSLYNEGIDRYAIHAWKCS